MPRKPEPGLPEAAVDPIPDIVPILPEPERLVSVEPRPFGVWYEMAEAPEDRTIFVASSLDDHPREGGVPAYWRKTRKFVKKAWVFRAFWASRTTGRELEFEPLMWREARDFFDRFMP
jgi:hypothetical protein